MFESKLESQSKMQRRREGIAPRDRTFLHLVQRTLICMLLLAPVVCQGQTVPLTPADYLDRATHYRQKGDLSREQFELTKALRAWPDSSDLRYAYALHLVRRKNLSEALVHTTHSLDQNQEQPIMANLHLQLLDGLNRPADSVAWLGHLLTLKRALPPLEPWSTEWAQRWQPVLQLGRKHADTIGNTGTRALIDEALRWAETVKPVTRSNESQH